jgi:hypothetical protein
MLDFVKRAFRNGIAAILWINLILSTIAGGIIGYYLGRLISYKNAGGYTFWGIVIGFICGLLTDIIVGGFITTILNIDEKIEAINNHLLGTGSTSNGKSTEISISSINNYTDISSPGQIGDIYIVIANTAIRSGPEEAHYVEKILKAGEKVSFKNVLDDNPNWFYVDTLDSKIVGWCFAGHLKKE